MPRGPRLDAPGVLHHVMVRVWDVWDGKSATYSTCGWGGALREGGGVVKFWLIETVPDMLASGFGLRRVLRAGGLAAPGPKRHSSSREGQACGMRFLVQIEQEQDGRWIVEGVELRGVPAHGRTPQEAKANVQALALRVVADRLEHGEAGPDLLCISLR